MDSFESIREQARELRTQAESQAAGPLTGPQLVELLLAQNQFEVIERDEDDALLHTAIAVLDMELAAIYIRRGLAIEDRTALVAHELGHLYLHRDSRTCEGEEVDCSLPDEASASGGSTVEGYGSRERRELQANVFGRELLLPRTLARELFMRERLPASGIAARMELPRDLVFQQLSDALLIPLTSSSAPPKSGERPGLNEAQRLAAEHSGSPLLLEAGPGTGKTRTLVARIVDLVTRGADPGSILALTFSNKAARELSERVAEELPEAAPLIWTGTFHAFGLEIMRKYYQFFELGPDIRMFSRTDAIELLEEMLPTLGLVYHQNLYEPALELKEMLAAISRAKDELVDAATYLSLAKAMRERAEDEDQIEAAERAIEVAQVYEIYEQALKEKKVVDFGDLIMKPTLLLEAQPAVCEAVRIRHRHILVDEYQDVNRASARLLKVIAGKGDRLWVVGDARQSIYRFRGASSANMALFQKDFPGATRMALETNYRSGADIVQLFTGFSREMMASRAALSLELVAARGQVGSAPELSELPDANGELAAVAARIGALQREGVAYRNQAVLCRSNKTLNDFAEALEARGIPVLYFGSLFEREEVRDMLALLSIAAENMGGGLMRVAHFPDYQIPLNDVSLFLNAVRESHTPVLQALEALDRFGEGMSEQGRRGLDRLRLDLEDLERHRTPWTMIVTYLFEKSTYLRALLEADTIAERMRCLALYQFLNFLRSQQPGGQGMPAMRLLQKVRLLILLGEERHLSQIPAAALGLDAVRLMTIHGSKGLEFEAVHLPSLVVTGFPMSYRPVRCPPPAGMLTLADGVDELEPIKALHEEEEECLFYVALSRAKQHLNLYRFRTSSNRNRSPSPFLARLLPAPRLVDVPDLMILPEQDPFDDRVHTEEPPPEETSAQQLEEYERCPRRYFYARVFGLVGSRKQSAFVKTHRCIYDVIDWVKRLEPGQKPTIDAVQEQLGDSWKKNGPVDHAFEAKYRELAERLVGNLVFSQAGLTVAPAQNLTVQLTHGKVRVEPDQVVTTEEGGTLLRVIKTGRKGSFTGEDTIYSLYQLGTEQHYGPGRSAVEVVHLSDRKTTPIGMTERKCATRIGKVDSFLADIKQGHFPPSTDPVTCPRCPYFFVCPTIPKGTLCRRRDSEGWPPGEKGGE